MCIRDSRNTDLFHQKFNKGARGSNYVFEVYSKEFVLKIGLQPFGLTYQLRVSNIGNVSYKVNFEKDVIGKDLIGKKQKLYETLFNKACSMIKKDRNNVRTSFKVVELAKSHTMR